MAKKMTTKEFKEIFNAAGFDFEIWGWEGILNMVSGYTGMLADLACSKGLKAAGKADRDRADYIFERLAEKGYYDT